MNSVFFVISKILGIFTSAAGLLLLVLVAGFLLGFTRWQLAGRRLSAAGLVVALLITFLPVDEWLVAPLEKRFPADPVLPSAVDGILILGGAMDTLASSDWQQPQLNSAADRLTAGVMLARRYPNAVVIFTGGSGLMRYPNLREADFAEDFFLGQGLARNRVFFESASRNTSENATYSLRMADPQEDELWVLVTSASHMPRAVGAFCKQGWSTVPWPVDHQSVPSRKWRLEFDFAGNLAGLNRALHEYVGLIAYAVTGKSNALFPDGC